MSQQTVTYRKPEHSVALAEWLLNNDPATLKEVAEIILTTLPGGRAEEEAKVEAPS
jgi:hypothetical protein